jgi:hypothetical protein
VGSREPHWSMRGHERFTSGRSRSERGRKFGCAVPFNHRWCGDRLLAGAPSASCCAVSAESEGTNSTSGHSQLLFRASSRPTSRAGHATCSEHVNSIQYIYTAALHAHAPRRPLPPPCPPQRPPRMSWSSAVAARVSPSHNLSPRSWITPGTTSSSSTCVPTVFGSQLVPGWSSPMMRSLRIRCVSPPPLLLGCLS